MPTTPAKPFPGLLDRRLLFFSLALTGALLAAGGAQATDANAADTGPAASSTANSGGLEEIVVTATRHEESLSKVPISDHRPHAGIDGSARHQRLSRVARFTPGVIIDTRNQPISIRGISSSAGAGTTGIYIDDTPIQMRELGFNPDETLPKTFDLHRIEVLRGPQGTLFGSGSEGGTVRYILTQPSTTRDRPTCAARRRTPSMASPAARSASRMASRSSTAPSGCARSIWYRYDGGWINRVDDTTGAIIERNINFSNTIAGRLAAVWQPTANLTVTPSVLYQRQDKNDDSTYWPAYSDASAGHFNTATPERVGGPDTYYLPALKIQWDLGNTQVISNTSYFHRKQITAYQGTVYDLAYYQSLGWPGNLNLGCGSASTTAGPPCSWYPLLDGRGIHMPPGFANYATPNTMTNQQRSWTQEFRLQSSDPDARVKWTTGIFWQVAEELPSRTSATPTSTTCSNRSTA